LPPTKNNIVCLDLLFTIKARLIGTIVQTNVAKVFIGSYQYFVK